MKKNLEGHNVVEEIYTSYDDCARITYNSSLSKDSIPYVI